MTGGMAVEEEEGRERERERVGERERGWEKEGKQQKREQTHSHNKYPLTHVTFVFYPRSSHRVGFPLSQQVQFILLPVLPPPNLYNHVLQTHP